MQLFNFSAEAQDVTVHFQIVQLPRQIYVWIGVGAPRMGNLALAMPTRLDPLPAVTTLVPGAADADASSMAQRLARRTATSVAVSLNLPADTPALRDFAERKVLQKLQELQLVGAAAALTV